MEEQMRAVCYARYSSDLQRETSIDDQIAVARRYAVRCDWTFLDDRVYSDAAVSGASLEGRPGILALLADAELTPRPFDVLLVDDSSRVARDLPDALHVLRMLKFAGIRTIYISQQIDSDSEQAEMLLTVHGLFDGVYLQEMAKKIKRGLVGQQDRGFHTGGKTFGYRSVPVYDPSGRRDADGPIAIGKRLEVDPEAAATIQRIYQRYVEGVSLPKMIDQLNREEVPSPRGTPWTKNTVDRILRNERYLGRQVWGQTTYDRKPGTNRLVPRKKPRAEWHVKERPDLRIISAELWQRVIERRTALYNAHKIASGIATRRGRSGLFSRHLLVGLTRCGTCGGAVSMVAGGYGSPRYGCPRSSHNGLEACDNRLTIMAKVVDPLVVSALQQELLRPEWIDAITEAVTDEVRTRLEDEPNQRAALIKRRDAVAKKLDSLLQAVEEGMPLPSLRSRIAERESEMHQIDADLGSLADRPTVNLQVFPTWVRQQLADLTGLLQDNPQRAKAELKRLNVRFTLCPIRDQGKPFLRAVGTGDLDALCGTTDLPSTTRSKAPNDQVHPFTSRASSLLRSGSDRDMRPVA